jgi:hypothetical protein
MGPQLERSSRVDDLQERADRLACLYPYASAPDLLKKTNRLRRLIDGLYGRVGPGRRADLMVADGWATLLASCLEHDLGRPARASALTGLARRLGAESRHSHLVAWSYEIAAWQALTAGHYADAARICRDAAAFAPRSDVGVQLKLQEAKALARMDMTSVARVAMADAEHVLNRLAPPVRPEHHFSVDRAKWLFYAAQVFDLAGESRPMLAFTRECMTQCIGPDGTTRWPMRVAELQLGLAHLHARAGALDAATAYGLQALTHSRQSGPSLLQRAIDLDVVFAERWPGEPRTREFRRVLRQLQHRYATLVPSMLA